jgi:hypothetical protein
MPAQLASQVATLALPVGVSLTPCPAAERRLQLSPSLHVRLSLSSGVAAAALSLALISTLHFSSARSRQPAVQHQQGTAARCQRQGRKATSARSRQQAHHGWLPGLHEDCFPVLLLSWTHGQKLRLVCYLALMFSITCYM